MSPVWVPSVIRRSVAPVATALLLLSVAPVWAQTGGGPRPTNNAPGSGALRGGTSDDDSAAIPVIGAPGGTNAAGPRVGSPGAANYGRPRPTVDPRTKYTGQPSRARRPLPGLQAYPTAPVLRQRVDSGRVATTRPTPTIAQTQQLARKPPPRLEADPYGPTGVMIGNLRLVPYVEADVGYDSNPNRTSTAAKGSTTLRGETGFNLQSNWSDHQLTANGQLGYTRYTSVPTASRPDGALRANLRLDVLRDTTVNLELRGGLTTTQPSSADFTALGLTVSGRPAVYTVGTTAGLTQAFGRFSLTASGLIDRTDYENATLSNGSIYNLGRDNYTSYGLRTRAAYEITPGITPFVEATADTRVRDNPVDASGYRRDSNGASAKVGSTFELSRVLTGQVSAGYSQRHYADSRLRDASGPTFDSSLIWTATPLTTVTLRATTDIAETTIPAASGAVTRTGSLGVDHTLMRNLTLGAVGTVQSTNYQGVGLSQNTYSGTLKADYNLTRWLVLRGSVMQERMTSSSPGSGYTANVYLLGLKLQR